MEKVVDIEQNIYKCGVSCSSFRFNSSFTNIGYAMVSKIVFTRLENLELLIIISDKIDETKYKITEGCYYSKIDNKLYILYCKSISMLINYISRIYSKYV